jgi:2-polyprenyl-6-methoxyphenol hydroxylase-like FAD-dependent oxidoreductase
MRIIVAGGGVAGTTAAIALRRNGADVEIIEAYPDPAGQVGSFLSLARNGLATLEALDCHAAVAAAGFEVPRQRLWSARGNLLADTARGRRATDPKHGITQLRTRLVAALRRVAAERGATITTGARVTAASADADGVTVRLSDGGTRRADLLVGADGIWSTLRTTLDPAAPTPRYAGLFTISGIAEGIPTEPGYFNMTFARPGAFVHVASPDGTTWWAAQVARPEPPDLSATTDAAWRDSLAHWYRHTDSVRRILAHTTQLHRPTLNHTLDPVGVVHNDRIVLIGDAAHPVGAGQGASMAIEDAFVLAQSLRANAAIPAALSAFADLRRPRIAKMLKSANDNRDSKTAGPIARVVRGAMMRLFVPLVFDRATAWLYDFDPGELPQAAVRS